MKNICFYCEKEYETKRDSSTYYSNSCRTGAYKYRKRVEQFEAENQKVLQAQKEAADKQKLIENELRNQKAEKRRKTKADKALKASQENEKIVNESSQVEAEIPTTELPPEELPKQLAKPEIKEEPKKHYNSFEVRKRLDAARMPKSDFWDILNKVVKAYNIYNKNKK